MSKPPVKRIDVERTKVAEIVERTRSGPLSEDDHATLEALMVTLLWLMDEVQKQKATAKRLYRALFGPSSEKTRDVLGENDGNSSTDEQGKDDDATSDSQQAAGGDAGSVDERKGHGRNPASAYRGAETKCVDHEALKPGDVCPGCKKGKVYELKVPAVLVRVTGGAPLKATRFELQRLRCNLCGEVFTAQAPAEADGDKHDASAAAMIALLKYGTGLPFNRLDRLQASLGIPLPKATQWDIVKEAAATAPSVIFEAMLRQAAQAEVLHNDDTTMPVLSLTGKRRAREAPADDPADRTGMFTTGIVARQATRRIAVYITGRQHAGENLEDLLRRRAAQLPPPTQMCDGLSRNLPATFRTILGNCLSHGRRHFVDVADNFPRECRHVLETLGEVFKHDATAREQGMSAAQRLAFHQAHSEPLMTGLKAWFEEQVEQKTVEPNSGLGQAFSYMTKRWDAMTLFLRQPGAPLDNNICERALKKAVLNRKNALFYRSLDGARVGDIFMSLIHTAELAGVDPLDYLVALLDHSAQATAAPDDWMPWSYEQTLRAAAAQP